MTKKLCFVHIPKCGGTSFNDAFRKSLGISVVSPFAGKVDAAKTRVQSEKRGIDLLDFRQEKLKSLLKKKRLRYVKGHVRCTEEVRSSFEQNWVFVTILRDPVKRWISQYFFNVHKKNDHFKHDVPLDRYLESSDGIKIGAQYVDFFTDGRDLQSESSVRQAIKNLESFAIVGILEKMEYFVKRYKFIFERDLIIGNKNVNPLSKDRIDQEVSASQLKKIEEICKPDIAIYNHFRDKIDLSETG